MIVSDEVYYKYVAPDTVTVYYSFCIPRETVEKNGLLQSIMQAEKLLKPSGLYYESYLDNFGRQLFYVISGSYTTLYMGFMLLIIACAVLALAIFDTNESNKGKICNALNSWRTTRTNETLYQPTGAMVFPSPHAAGVFEWDGWSLCNATLSA